jgi:hypothetical protein
MQLQGKEREDCIKDMKSLAIKTFKCSQEQADKRVEALLTAIDNGLFDGIPETGPEDIFQTMFVDVKVKQIMGTEV